MELLTFDDRAPELRRGVLAKNDPVTPSSSPRDDASKFKLSLRDVLLLLCGSLAMYGVQLATQYGMRSDIRNLGTQLESYQVEQMKVYDTVQRQLDEWEKETKLNRINIENTERSLSELRGILLGAGIKGIVPERTNPRGQ